MSSPSSSKKSGRRGPSSPPRALQITLKDLPTSKDDFDRASASLHSSTYKEAFRADYDVHFDSPINQTQIALVGTKVVGGVYCKLMQPPAGNTSVYIMCLSVSRSFLLDGIDTILLNHVLHVTTNEPIHEIFTHVRVDDQDRLTFFLNHGFLKIEHVPEEYAGIHLSRCYLLRWTSTGEMLNPTEEATNMTADFNLTATEGTTHPVEGDSPSEKAESKDSGNSKQRAKSTPDGKTPDGVSREGEIEEFKEQMICLADGSNFSRLAEIGCLMDASMEAGLGKVIIGSDLEEAESSAYSLGFLPALQHFELQNILPAPMNIQTTPRQVFSKCYCSKFEPYITERENLVHHHIQLMFARASGGESKKLLISYEKVDLTVSSLIKMAKVHLPLEKWDALIHRVTNQSVDAVIYLHSMNMVHGKLTSETVCISFNTNFKENQIEYYDVKLLLPAPEELNGRGYSLKCTDNACYSMDHRAIADIVRKLYKSLPGNKVKEYGELEYFFKKTTNFSMKELGRQVSMLLVNTKIELTLLMSGKMGGYSDFESKKWTDYFRLQINAMNTELAKKSLDPFKEEKTLDNYVLFQRHTFAHYHEWERSNQIVFGHNKADVVSKFLMFYDELYCNMYSRAVYLGLLESFFKGNNM